MSEQFSIADVLFLERIGVDGAETAEWQTTSRSEWTPERLLQAASDGELTVTGLDEATPDNVVRIWIDGRSARSDEYEAVIDLVGTDHLVFVGNRVALTATGRATLARWSKYRLCIRRRQDDGGEQS